MDDVYTKMGEMGDYFDFSNYPKNHPLYSTAKIKVAGKFKDELGGSILDKYIGADEEKITAKGVKKSVKDKALSVDTYEKCLFDHQQKSHHELYSLRPSSTVQLQHE